MRKISIQRKMTLVTLAVCSVVLLLATGALFTYQMVAFRQAFKRDLSVTAEIIANNSAAPLTFKDANAAEEVLSALKSSPQVLSAWIQLPDGHSFASYGATTNRAGIEAVTEDGSRFENNYLLQREPINLGGERLGTLFLRSDYNVVFTKLLHLYAGMFALVLAVSILVAFLLSAGLHKFISGPILTLAHTAREVAEKKDYSVRARKTSEDELGLFTDAFNQMLAQIQAQDTNLQQAREHLAKQVEALQHEISERKNAETKLKSLHKQLLDASRSAGMAEVATGVLHNVGNVLNSVNVSVTLMQEQVRKSKVENFARVVDMLEEHASHLGTFLTTDPKGQLVPRYLRQLADHLALEHKEGLRMMEGVAKNVEHIKKIVAMQQSFSKVVGVQETLPASELVEDALQINASGLERHGITLERQYSEELEVTVDKHRVLQILINLIRNAKYALDEGGKHQKLLRLGIGRNGNNCLKITVADNGIGIPPENLTRVFCHGFTTRKEGHGFGLHSGALAAKEMGGSLLAHSDGPGHGATFVLELPIRKQEDNS